jgi:hypothetical protein
MDPQALVETVQLVRDGGSTALLVAAIVGGFRGWYVWGWQYREKIAACQLELAKVERDRDEWKAVALRGLSVAERITG